MKKECLMQTEILLRQVIIVYFDYFTRILDATRWLQIKLAFGNTSSPFYFRSDSLLSRRDHVGSWLVWRMERQYFVTFSTHLSLRSSSIHCSLTAIPKSFLFLEAPKTCAANQNLNIRFLLVEYRLVKCEHLNDSIPDFSYPFRVPLSVGVR